MRMMTKRLEDILIDKIDNWYKLRSIGSRTPKQEKEFAELSNDILIFNPMIEYEKYFDDERDIKEIKTYWVMHMSKKIDNWYEIRSNSSRTPEQEIEFTKLSNEILMLNPTNQLFEKYFADVRDIEEIKMYSVMHMDKKKEQK